MRICLQCRRPRFDRWIGKIPWRREWQPTPLFLPGELHGQESLVSYSPWGHKESDMTEQLTLPTNVPAFRHGIFKMVTKAKWCHKSGILISYDWLLTRRERDTRGTQIEERPCEVTVRRQPSANQEERLYSNWNSHLDLGLLLASRTRRKYTCCLSHPVSHILLWQPRQTTILWN